MGSVLSGVPVKQKTTPVIMAANGFFVLLLALYLLLFQKKLSKL